jgi:hypothetical protein
MDWLGSTARTTRLAGMTMAVSQPSCFIASGPGPLMLSRMTSTPSDTRLTICWPSGVLLHLQAMRPPMARTTSTSTQAPTKSVRQPRTSFRLRAIRA